MKITNWTNGIGRKFCGSPKKSTIASGTAILAGSMFFCGTANADVDYFEDFEGVSLEAGTGITPVSWSRTVDGWIVDNSAMDGVSDAIEYQGGAVLDLTEWVAEAGQGRTDSGFLGGNQALVFDPDEWDDERVGGNDPSTGYNSSWSRIFDFGGENLSSIEISFGYEFLSYPTQRMMAEVSFDGGSTYQTLLDLDSSAVASSTDLSGFSTFNSGTDFNATSEEMELKFSMTVGGNDWWGAVDNITVSSVAVPEPTSAGLIGLGVLGLAAIRRRS